jgi:hypothetical protein
VETEGVVRFEHRSLPNYELILLTGDVQQQAVLGKHSKC